MGSGCSQSDLIYASKPDNHFSCFDRALTAALLTLTLSPFSSLLAVVWLFGTICVNVIKRRAAHRRDSTVEYRLVRYPIELYLLSLFCSDFVLSISFFMNLRWVIEGKIYINDYCKAAGFMTTIGETGVAMSTTAIAIHTFVSVWYNKVSKSFLIPWVVIGAIWAYNILFSFILFLSTPERRHEFFAPVPYWCWINPGSEYLPWRILAFYLWLWIGMLFSILCYVSLFLWRLGYITVAQKPWWKFQVHRRRVTSRPLTRGSYAMILYPLVYFILGTPLSIARWMFFVWQPQGHHLSPVATIFTAAIFHLDGLCNVFLFVYTRQGLLLYPERRNKAAGGHESGQTPRSAMLGIVGNGVTHDMLERLGNHSVLIEKRCSTEESRGRE